MRVYTSLDYLNITSLPSLLLRIFRIIRKYVRCWCFPTTFVLYSNNIPINQLWSRPGPHPAAAAIQLAAGRAYQAPSDPTRRCPSISGFPPRVVKQKLEHSFIFSVGRLNRIYMLVCSLTPLVLSGRYYQCGIVLAQWCAAVPAPDAATAASLLSSLSATMPLVYT